MSKISEIDKKYKALINQLSCIGYVIKGSIGIVRYKCGQKNCICFKDKAKRHGPYFILTSKDKGRTVSKRLSEKQVKICKKYIENNKKLKIIIEKMRKLSIEPLDFGKK